jgi:RhtB (resistance to homoserine/threonine) family protein
VYAPVLDQFFVIVVVTGLAMVTPGPDMLLVLRNTLVDGRRAGLHTSLGVLAGNLVHITYCVLGIGWVISRSILAYSILKYAGAVYLIYLGIASVRSSKVALDTSAIHTPEPFRTWFTRGFINNLLNPKGALFYLGVFTTVIRPETSPGVTIALVLVMMSISAVFWLCFVYALDRRPVRGYVDQSQQVITRVFGAILIALGLKVALSQR